VTRLRLPPKFPGFSSSTQIYTLAYRRLVRFGVPAWLVVRAKARQAAGNELLLRSEGSTKIGSGL